MKLLATIKTAVKTAVKTTAKQLMVWTAQALIGAAMIVFTLLMLIEWASGCGEAYTDSKGEVHTNECVHKTIYRHLSETN